MKRTYQRQTSRISLDMNDLPANKLNLDNYIQNKPAESEKLKQYQRNQVMKAKPSHLSF